MPDAMDRLLAELELPPPDDFTARVMGRLHDAPLPAPARRPTAWLEWLALAGGALLGATHIAGFIFGIWTAGAAG